ncbi:nucleotidyltransferase family protein [Vibrio methylphosphonaticus]|uniref:nucleotidyltransferase family protein n=1 Tax=Vibrio methylphosphonaticus TaxID=2946866 RepID=UPI00202A5460|nr:nucleotidyltransferase family protein [Vibrio methylphosphonaticus]MCL9773754.1 nucleotidyltransferase family protein [Vibrio methylphosphonaticus]
METIALLLAAGNSQRFGEDKRFIGSPPLLSKTLLSLYSTFDRVVLVHKDGDDLSSINIDYAKVTLVSHDNTHDPSLGASIARGIKTILSVDNPPDFCAIFLADMPFIHSMTLTNLVRFTEEKHTQSLTTTIICRPRFEGQSGHPVIFSRALFDALSRLTREEGAKSIIKQNHAHFYEFDCDDLGVCADIDTLEAAKLHGLLTSST